MSDHSELKLLYVSAGCNPYKDLEGSIENFCQVRLAAQGTANLETMSVCQQPEIQLQYCCIISGAEINRRTVAKFEEKLIELINQPHLYNIYKLRANQEAFSSQCATKKTEMTTKTNKLWLLVFDYITTNLESKLVVSKSG